MKGPLPKFSTPPKPVLTGCALCAIALPLMGAESPWSWQRPHAEVLPHGDLQWSPEPFTFESGESTRYIDYANGDDNNDGSSRDSAWKHHPWDPQAGGKAADASGIHTYVFKQGVAYRGQLIADESGADDNPIRLTRDPDWGTGEAALYGSIRVDSGWQRASADAAPEYMPEPDKVWYIDLDLKHRPDGIWIDHGPEQVVRMELARDPNWTVSNPDDPQSEWHVWEDKNKIRKGERRGRWMTNKATFQGKDPDFFAGAIIWSEWAGNMGTVNFARWEEQSGFDPERGQLATSDLGTIDKGNRFFIENVPGYLDSPGEYYYASDGEFAGRLYLRAPGDADPNGLPIEVSDSYQQVIRILDQSHIHISGLRFSFINTIDFGFPEQSNKPTAIYAAGEIRDLTVCNNRFHHVNGVVTVHPRLWESQLAPYMSHLAPWKQDAVDQILICDNDISYSSGTDSIGIYDGQGLYRAFTGEVGRVGTARILRNRLYWTGFRQGPEELSNATAIQLDRAAIGEIAGNIVDMSWGSGIFTFSGNKHQQIDTATPLTRLFIHHNKVTNAMLATNDWGGIAYWQGGPIYTYSNIAGNIIGHKSATELSNDWKTVAYNYYLDGTFKSYTFNNIAWGKYNDMNSPYRSRGPYFVVLGFMNHCFQNSYYHFRHGILGSSGNRSTFMANVVSNITGQFIQQNRSGDTSLRGGGDTGEQGNRGMPTNAYGYNVFFGMDHEVGNARMVRGDNIEDWQQQLDGIQARLSQTGWKVPGEAFVQPDPYGAHDFRLQEDSPAKDRGIRFFVPFGLYKMVGEWNFIRHPGNEELILGEGFYMDESYMHRHMYEDVPRNDLQVPGATAANYIDGALEDWPNGGGALRLDGTLHAVLTHEDIVGDFQYKRPLNDRGLPGRKKSVGTWTEDRETLDMERNNFLIEAYLRLPDSAANGAIVAKQADGKGYELAIADGRPQLQLDGETSASARAVSSIADGDWHHLIAELDRHANMVRFYIDGRLDHEQAIDLSGSLANTGDFLVGKGASGQLTFDIDFLRLSRGTLADALTSIEELHAWQSGGPHTRDFIGAPITDGKRDAGAIELQ